MIGCIKKGIMEYDEFCSSVSLLCLNDEACEWPSRLMQASHSVIKS